MPYFDSNKIKLNNFMNINNDANKLEVQLEDLFSLKLKARGSLVWEPDLHKLK